MLYYARELLATLVVVCIVLESMLRIMHTTSRVLYCSYAYRLAGYPKKYITSSSSMHRTSRSDMHTTTVTTVHACMCVDA